MFAIVRRRKPQAGFTLVELLVVVTIIGILAAMGVPRLFAYVRTSETAEVAQNAARIDAAIRGWVDAQLITAANAQTTLDGTTVTADGTGTLVAIIPHVAIPTTSAFTYTLGSAVAADGPQAGQVVYCVQASSAQGIVLYSSAATTAVGWESKLNRNPYIDGVTDPLTISVTAGGYCTATGTASDTFS